MKTSRSKPATSTSPDNQCIALNIALKYVRMY